MSRSISVIIPLHNGAAYIEACLCSVQAQLLRADEILVIDDHSVDDGAARAAVFPGVRVIPAPAAGPAAARQTGISAASGARLAFLDQDDLWAPSHLAELNATLDRHPNCAFAYARAIPFADGTLPAFSSNNPTAQAVDPWAWQPSCYVLTPSCAMVERQALLGIGGWTVEHPVADLYTWLALSAASPAMRIEPASVGYRQSAGSNAQRLRRDPHALLAQHVETLRAVLPLRVAAKPKDQNAAAKLQIVERLGALDRGDELALTQLADALAALPADIAHTLSHAHWLFGPSWRANSHKRLHALRQLYPKSHPSTSVVVAWIDDCLRFSELLEAARKHPLDLARWHALLASAWRRALRRLKP